MFVCLYACVGSSTSRGGISFPPFPFILTTKFLQISSFSNHMLSREALNKKDFKFIPIATLKTLLLIACASKELPFGASRTIIHPKANKRNAPRINLKLFEGKYWKLTTVAATIRDGGAEQKLMPGFPAGLEAQTHHNGQDQQPENGLASKPQFLHCNYSEAFDPKCIML